MNDELKQRIKGLEKLANMQSSVRAQYAARLRMQTVAIDLAVLVASTALALTIFADASRIANALRVSSSTIVAAQTWFSLLNFITVLIVLYLRPTASAKLQRDARRHYTEVRRHFEALRKGTDTTPGNVDEATKRYLDDVHYPEVPRRLFNRYRRNFLQDLAFNAAVEDNPFVGARELRRQLRSGTYNPPSKKG